jgi:hypothetical protein
MSIIALHFDFCSGIYCQFNDQHKLPIDKRRLLMRADAFEMRRRSALGCQRDSAQIGAVGVAKISRLENLALKILPKERTGG